MQHDKKTREQSDVRGIIYSDKLHSYIHKKSCVSASLSNSHNNSENINGIK